MATPTARRYVEELETHRSPEEEEKGPPVPLARRRVPQERLLVYEVKEGWGPSCEFLGVEGPDKPFPRLNDAAEEKRMKGVVRILTVAIPPR